MQIPNPNHFSDIGSTGGAISMLSSYMMGNSDFMSGNFPAEYGNATSGIFDIHLRNGNDLYRNFSIQAGVIGLDISASGPLRTGIGSSYIANYRYSSLAILSAMGIKILGDATPDFQDFAFKINIPTEKGGKISFWGLGGLSLLNESLSQMKHQYGYNMFTGGLNYQYWFNQKNFISSALALAYSNNGYAQIILPNDSLDDNLTVYEHHIINNSIKYTLAWLYKFSNQLTFKTGIEMDFTNYTFDLSINDSLFTAPSYAINNQGSTSINQGYLSLRWGFAPNFSLNTGVHGLYFHLNGHYNVEARANIKWQLRPRHSIAFGVGQYLRTEHLTQYFAEITDEFGEISMPNKDLDFTKSMQYGLSYSYNINTNLFFRMELYYQNQYNIPIKDEEGSHISLINSKYGIVAEPLVNKGLGKNKGVELMLQKFYSNGTIHLISVSLFDSRYKANTDQWYNTAFNNKFAVQMLSGKEINISSNKLIGFGGRMHWTGGRRYTAIDLEKSIERGYAAYDENNIFGTQADNYFRLDIQMRFVNNRTKFTSEWKLDIQNLTNKLNMFGIYYNALSQSIEKTYQTGLVPVLSYVISFNRE